jgi:hypothetical protein
MGRNSETGMSFLVGINDTEVMVHLEEACAARVIWLLANCEEER